MVFKTPEESGNDMALMLLFFAEHGAYCSFLVVAVVYFQIKSGIFRRRDARRGFMLGSKMEFVFTVKVPVAAVTCKTGMLCCFLRWDSSALAPVGR
jgi:hypothetical protein